VDVIKLTDEVATEQLRSLTAEIVACENCAANKKHGLQNGEAKVVDIEEKEAGKSVINGDKCDVVEAAQA
jgi:hypothetical protein